MAMTKKDTITRASMATSLKEKFSEEFRETIKVDEATANSKKSTVASNYGTVKTKLQNVKQKLDNEVSQNKCKFGDKRKRVIKTLADNTQKQINGTTNRANELNQDYSSSLNDYRQREAATNLNNQIQDDSSISTETKAAFDNYIKTMFNL